jgi:hypothetical protein
MGDVSLNGAIQAYDASLVLQYFITSISLNETQKKVADVSGNGDIVPYDAALILQYLVGTIQSFPAEMKSAHISSVDYAKLVVGSANIENGENISIPLTVTDVSEMIASEIEISYDPTLLEVNEVQNKIAGMNLLFKNDTQKGLLTIVMAGADPLTSSTVLAEILFHTKMLTVKSKTTELSVSKFIANESDMTSEATNGDITIYNNSIVVDKFTPAFNNKEIFRVYPNPSSGNANLSYELKEDNQNVTIELFSLYGQRIATLVNGNEDKGSHTVSILNSGNPFESGTYFIRMTVNGYSQSQKFLIVR